jgi:hypothetical protein
MSPLPGLARSFAPLGPIPRLRDRGPHYFAADAASTEAEAYDLTLSGLLPAAISGSPFTDRLSPVVRSYGQVIRVTPAKRSE